MNGSNEYKNKLMKIESIYIHLQKYDWCSICCVIPFTSPFTFPEKVKTATLNHWMISGWLLDFWIILKFQTLIHPIMGYLLGTYLKLQIWRQPMMLSHSAQFKMFLLYRTTNLQPDFCQTTMIMLRLWHDLFLLPGSLQLPCLVLYRAIPTSFYLAFWFLKEVSHC